MHGIMRDYGVIWLISIELWGFRARVHGIMRDFVVLWSIIWDYGVWGQIIWYYGGLWLGYMGLWVIMGIMGYRA